MFKFRNKEEKIGLILGCTCFIPIFLISMMLFEMKPLVGIVLLIVSQSLWIISIAYCTRSLEIENRKLKEQLKKENLNE